MHEEPTSELPGEPDRKAAGEPVLSSAIVRPLTVAEFIDDYCARSGLTRDWLLGAGGRVALPCECGDATCRGWAMVRNDPASIQTHRELYGPNAEVCQPEGEKKL